MNKDNTYLYRAIFEEGNLEKYLHQTSSFTHLPQAFLFQLYICSCEMHVEAEWFFSSLTQSDGLKKAAALGG
jgi:hypothetical protein